MASTARTDELRKKFEENPRRYFAPLANEYRKAGDIEQAIAICREHLPQQPGHMSGHIVFGQALYEARQFDEARTVFETALGLDPENLIALRHLGDIALILGDTEVARSWYRRVLEADPRNEEIQAQLASLDQSAAPPAQADAPPAETPAPAAASPTPSSMPTIVMAAALETIPTQLASEPAPPVEMALGFEPTSAASPADVVSAAPAMAVDVPVSSQAEPPPLDSFSLEGLETTSLAAPAPAPQPIASDALPDLDFGAPASPSADGEPQAAAPADLDFLDVPAAEPAADAVSVQSAGVDELPLLDVGEIPSVSASADAESETDVEVASSVGIDAPESGPFVTETMAELYLQQGHTEEALRVYRALLQARPGDESLRAKIARLSTPEVPPHATYEPQAAGAPSIRELLVALAQRRPGHRVEIPRQNGGQPSAAVVEEYAVPATPVMASFEDDAIAALFGGGAINPLDEAAAQALATAFAHTNGGSAHAAEGIGGAPARQASGALSLDAVFGAESAAPAGGGAASSFSFDQFFSPQAAAGGAAGAVDLAAGAAGAAGPAGAAGAAADDVAQFTDWLEGLKRR